MDGVDLLSLDLGIPTLWGMGNFWVLWHTRKFLQARPWCWREFSKTDLFWCMSVD